MAQGKPTKTNAPPSDKAEEFQPRGTLVMLFIFMLLLIILWGSVYLILLSRGVTI
jgi:hypothetical protein